jgi:hypothetical protein
MPALPGGGFLTEKPIWHPPISVPWMLSLFIIIGASNVEAMPPQLQTALLHPLGFFATFLLALGAYDSGFPPAAFAILFFLLMLWTQRKRQEGFGSHSGAVDWVTNNKRWFAEVVLKEKPMGIKERDVRTYPVQGDNSLPSSASN